MSDSSLPPACLPVRPVEVARREDRAAREAATKVHSIIPYEYFTLASSECRELYLDGHFYGCIALSQSVAEGLAKFPLRVRGVKSPNDPVARVGRLRRAGIISGAAEAAFQRIRGEDRNTFHHLNEDVPVDLDVLDRRAKECVDALYVIESEIFEFTIVAGALVPKRPEYWPKTGADQLAVYLRLA